MTNFKKILTFKFIFGIIFAVFLMFNTLKLQIKYHETFITINLILSIFIILFNLILLTILIHFKKLYALMYTSWAASYFVFVASLNLNIFYNKDQIADKYIFVMLLIISVGYLIIDYIITKSIKTLFSNKISRRIVKEYK